MIAMLPAVTPNGSGQAQKRQTGLLAFYTQTITLVGRGVINHSLGLLYFCSSVRELLFDFSMAIVMQHCRFGRP